MSTSVVTGATKTQAFGMSGAAVLTSAVTLVLAASDYVVFIATRPGTTGGTLISHNAGNPATPTISTLYTNPGDTSSKSTVDIYAMKCLLAGTYAFDVNTNNGVPNSVNTGPWVSVFVLQGQHSATPFIAGDASRFDIALGANAPSWPGWTETGHGEALLLAHFGFGRVNLGSTPLTGTTLTGWTAGPSGWLNITGGGTADPGGFSAYKTVSNLAATGSMACALSPSLNLYEQFAYVAIRPGGGWTTYPAKVWNGSTWVTKPGKVWDGSAWVTKPTKVWMG